MTKILVTGAAGFLGSHLIDSLVSRGDEVVGLDNLHRGKLDHIADHLTTGKLTFIRGDICSLDDLQAAMQGVETVFHLAAQSNVMGSLSNPDYSFSTNVTGTYTVLKAAATAGVGKLVFSSSREVYGEPESLPVSELDLPQPKNMYGASKLAGEAYCRAFNETTSLKCTVVRFGNIYGTRDADRVIPIWLDRAAHGDDLLLYGGEQVLDFVFVDHAVAALRAAAEYEGFGPINVASGKGTTLRELARRILDDSNSMSSLSIEPARAIEVTKFVADISKMRRELGLQQPAEPLDGLPSMLRASSAVESRAS